jgi:hypothetical protein
VLAGALALGLFGGIRASAQGLADPGGSTYLPIGKLNRVEALRNPKGRDHNPSASGGPKRPALEA